MLYNIYSHIVINDSVVLNTFNSLMINNSINELTSTATITIPYHNISLTAKELIMKSDSADDLAIKKGDSINISLNYYTNQFGKDGLDADINRNSVFIGYIKSFSVEKDLILINIEDTMFNFKLKKMVFSTSKDNNAKEFFQYIIDFYDQFDLNTDNVADTNLGKLKSDGYVTAAEVFQKLKKDYKLFTYINLIDNVPTLFFGLKYPLDATFISQTPFNFAYPYDSSRYVITENALSYQTFDKKGELIIVGEYINNITNKKVQIATIDGENVITDKKIIDSKVEKRNIRQDIKMPTSDVDTLTELILQSWNNHPESSFTGSFKTLGMPLIRPGNIVDLKIDDGFKQYIVEQYYVDAVTISITPNQGFIQEITIGAKIKQ